MVNIVHAAIEDPWKCVLLSLLSKLLPNFVFWSGFLFYLGLWFSFSSLLLCYEIWNICKFVFSHIISSWLKIVSTQNLWHLWRYCIIRRWTPYICMYCNGNHNIMQEADQKLKGPLSVRGSSSRRPLQVDLSKLEVSCFLLVLKVIIKLFLTLAPIH